MWASDSRETVALRSGNLILDIEEKNKNLIVEMLASVWRNVQAMNCTHGSHDLVMEFAMWALKANLAERSLFAASVDHSRIKLSLRR